ncbi:MAG: ATP-binding cassette domain-containing protein [Pseudobdellovibrio sp.]
MSHIEFRNITKAYGDYIACRNVSLSIKKSTIHAIIGENGAGKSTLVKLLGGITPATSGEMLLDGDLYKPQSAQDAFKNRIAFIHQHFVLADELTALDNLILSASSDQFSLKLKNKDEVLSRAQFLLKRFGWQTDLHKLVKHISVGEAQRLEILKALMQEPEIIIFDEPTAVLTPQESHELLKFILQLKTESKTIIIISHKLNEIKFVADEISVLRQGQLVSTHEKDKISTEQMAELMIGRRIVKNNSNAGISSEEFSITIPNTTIRVQKSEIFGVIGIEGNGQETLISLILQEFKKNSLSFGDITEDRIKLSVFDELNLSEHLLLKHKNLFTKNGIINLKSLESVALKLVTDWDVRPPDINKALSDFSGGNQQKFVVGRELLEDPEILLAAHPTRGVDLGAQEKIHNSMLAYAKSNKSIILVSSDLDEALFLSDRFIILNKNKISF